MGTRPANFVRAGAYWYMLPDMMHSIKRALGNRRGMMFSHVSFLEHSISNLAASSGLGWIRTLLSTSDRSSGSVIFGLSAPVLMSSITSRHCFCSACMAPTIVAARTIACSQLSAFSSSFWCEIFDRKINKSVLTTLEYMIF